MARVLPPDLEAWLASYVREQLRAAGHDVEVGTKEPDTLAAPLKRPLVVIRDDSGDRLSQVSFDRSIGVSVLAGTRQHDRPARDLSRLVAAIIFDDQIAEAPGSPIAAVDPDGCNGPYAVTDPHNVSRRYLTAAYVVVGSW